MTIKKITAVITAIIVMLSSVLPCFATEDTEIINIDTSNFDYLVSLGITGYNKHQFEVYHRLYDVINISVVSDRDTVGYFDMNSKVVVKDV